MEKRWRLHWLTELLQEPRVQVIKFKQVEVIMGKDSLWVRGLTYSKRDGIINNFYLNTDFNMYGSWRSLTSQSQINEYDHLLAMGTEALK